MAAKVDAVDRTYFESVIAPMLRQYSADVEFVGEISEAQKGEFLGNAAALLFPVDWPEPFGLVMIEAMACGTPVIAFNRGSVPEVLRDGVSGFIVEDENGAAAAVERIAMIDRKGVRAEFERRFTAWRMARRYVRIYEEIADRREFPLPAMAAG